MNNKILKISVIIPFYQKEKGLLRKAVQSVLDQDYKCNMDIIIVDDGSPTPAYPECENLQYDKNRINIQIIKQKNKGMAAARNLGLENISRDTDYIAFLNSNDIWHTPHLSTIFEHSQNFDLYLSHHILHYMNNNIPLNYKINFPFNGKSEKIKRTDLLIFKDDPITLVMTNIFRLSISSLIFNYNTYKSVRFDKYLQNKTESIFLISLIFKTKSLLYSNLLNVVCQTDFLSFSSTCDNSIVWNDPLFIIEGYKNLRYNTKLLSLLENHKFPEKHKYITRCSEKIKCMEDEIFICFLHLLFHRKHINWKYIYKTIQLKPISIISPIKIILRKIHAIILTPKKDSKLNIYFPHSYQNSLVTPQTKYSATMTIPKIFHRIWIPFHKDKPEIPELYKEFDKYLKNLHPNWTFMEWNDTTVEQFIKEYYPNFLETYTNYDQPVKRHDAVRYLIIKHYGGVFIQHSIRLFKNIEPLFQEYGAVFSVQSKYDHTIANSFFATVPYHPIFDDIEEELKQRSIIQDPTLATGPLLITEIVNKYLEKHKANDIGILPTKFLFPFDWNEKYQQPYYTHCFLDYNQASVVLPESYGFCRWAGSWISTFVEIKNKEKNANK